MAFVQAVCRAYEHAGRSPAAALAAAQIAPQAAAQARGHVSADAFERLCDHAMRELDDEALGWFRRRLPWGSYGLLARASLSAPTLGLALRRWCRHHGLLTDDVALHLSEREGTAWLAIEERRELGDLREFALVSLLRNALGLFSWMADSRIVLDEAHFPYPAPAHAADYAVLFTETLRFSAAQAAVAFDARYLALPVQRDEAAMNRMLQHALPLWVRRYQRDRLLMPRARAALLHAPLTEASAEAVAARLALSARTLHRRLREEGTSWQALKDAVRRERALRLVQRGDRPLKQIAAEVGFRNEKSFSRAFRQWTGEAPGRYGKLLKP